MYTRILNVSVIKYVSLSPFFSFQVYYLFMLGPAGPSSLRGLFPSCGEQALLFTHSAQAFHAATSLVKPGLQGARASAVRLPDYWAQAQYLWPTGLVALRHVGSSRIRDQTCVSCFGRGILYLWAARQDPRWPLYHKVSSHHVAFPVCPLRLNRS